jgi:hypothetical protein
MSFHTVTMMVRWAVTADKQTATVLDNLKRLPMETRVRDPRVLQIVQEMKRKWSVGTKIERLATLGWLEFDSIAIFCNMLDNLDQLRKEYLEQVLINGLPPDLNDDDIQSYEATVKKAQEEMKK